MLGKTTTYKFLSDLIDSHAGTVNKLPKLGGSEYIYAALLDTKVNKKYKLKKFKLKQKEQK